MITLRAFLHGRLFLSGALALGLALRVAHVLALQRTPWFDNLDIDPAFYDAWAQRLAAGDWVGHQPFFMEPLYPYFLGVLYRVAGRDLLLVRLVQAAIGVGTCALTAQLGRRLWNPLVGNLAALVAAVFLPAIFYEAEIEKTFLAVFFVALTLVLYFTPSPRARLLAGASLAVASLARGNLVVLLPLGALALALTPTAPPLPGLLGRLARVRTRQLPSLGLGVLFLLGGAAALSPVWVRNSVLAGHLSLSTAHGGQNFYVGNNRGNQRGGFEAPAFVRPNPEYEQGDYRAYAEAKERRPLNPGEVSAYFWAEGLREIRADVPRWLKLEGRKLALFWNDYEVPDNQDFYFLARDSWVLRLPLPTFGWLVPLAAVAALLLGVRREVRVLLGFVAAYCLAVVAFFVLSRFRVQVVPVLCVLSAAGAHELALQWRSRAAWGVALVAGLAALVAFRPLPGYSKDMGVAQSLTNLGALWVHRGERLKALELYEQALQVEPTHDRTLRDRGVLLLQLGRVEEARASFERCVSLNPRNSEAWLQLGHLYEAQGQLEAAGAAYGNTVLAQPGNAEAAFSLATVLQKQSRYEKAVSVYRQMLQTLPDEPRVHHNLALALMNSGQLDEARAEGARSAALGLPLPAPVLERLKAP